MSWHLYIGALVALTVGALVHADGRPGVVQFSDGRTLKGGLLLSPGKNLRLYTNDTTAVSLSLDEVKEMRLKVEKEEMRKGFYFPNPGQATQAETGDVYPVRYFSVDITLEDGKTLSGHLLTTMLYLENDDGTQKVPLMAKITGEDGQKIDDMVYPADIRFDVGATTAGATMVDLTQAGFTPKNPPVIFAKPDLSLLPVAPIEGRQAWTVPADHPEDVMLSVEAPDGIHVSWPMEPSASGQDDPTVRNIVEAALVEMHDFFDTRKLLGCVREDDDIYTLVMLSRVGKTDSFAAGKVPWSLVAMRWKYDADQKKVVLLNRTILAVGRADDNSPAPAVLKQPELLRDITKP